jgi:hypothetical protein
VSEDEDEPEIVCESYRHRIRLMDRLIAPFDFLELLVVVGGAIGAIVWLLRVW